MILRQQCSGKCLSNLDADDPHRHAEDPAALPQESPNGTDYALLLHLICETTTGYAAFACIAFADDLSKLSSSNKQEMPQLWLCAVP